MMRKEERRVSEVTAERAVASLYLKLCAIVLLICSEWPNIVLVCLLLNIYTIFGNGRVEGVMNVYHSTRHGLHYL